MALRVSLQIDGDSSGAEAAAKGASEAVKGLGKDATDAAKGLEDAFKKAAGAAGNMAGAAQAAGAANDNLVGKATGMVGLLDQVAQKTLGADNAFAKLTAGAVNVAKGVGAIGPMVGTIGLLSGGLGIAATAASTFFAIVNNGNAAATIGTQDHERLVDRLRGAYSGAAKEAKKLFDATRDLRIVQLGTEIGNLKAERDSIVRDVISDFDKRRQAYTSPFTTLTVQRFTGFDAQADAFNRLAGSIKGLRDTDPDLTRIQQQLGGVGRAAGDSGSEISKAAEKYGTWLDQAQEVDKKLKDRENARAFLTGTATPKQADDFLNQGKAAATAATEFDRMAKALSRQIVVQEAEAASVGKSAGEQTKLRDQMLLVEAAQRSGLDAAGKYAAAIDAIAGRAGAAGQKLAEMQIRSNAAFDLSQLGRNASEQSIAGILRGAYGDNVDAVMNGAIAGTLRFNAAMADLKNTTLDVARGAMADFRSEIANGATAWQSFEKAGLNALQRVIDKIVDNQLDTLISKMFGAFLGGGSSSGGGLIGRLIGGVTGTSGADGLAAIHHSGYGPGDSFPTRMVAAGAFAGAPRFHSGIGPGERPAIIRDDESVLTAGQMRALGRATMNAQVPIHVNNGDIHITVEGSADEKTIAAIGSSVRREFDRRDAQFHDKVIQAIRSGQERWQI